MLNSPNAYEQNKAFTKHIVEVVTKALEENLELKVSIPRKLYDEWEPTSKLKIKIDDKGSKEESTLARRRLDNSEGENLLRKL